ncbi:unnamed protein product [Ceratitis capitata]|uniref:(Mediterranean fruit fly) hypothetical protein n=1 Tax=Ceratitis capitata TaxID=7213 RepID=A0A811U3E4_CERCA|nr:unnamed protein product [Ceratitis capitata]
MVIILLAFKQIYSTKENYCLRRAHRLVTQFSSFVKKLLVLLLPNANVNNPSADRLGGNEVL